MSDVNEPVRQQLKNAGVAEQYHDELLALKGPAEAKGLNWLKLIELLPSLIEIFKKFVGGNQPQTTSKS